MSTQRMAALEGRITEVMRYVAEQEGLEVEEVRAALASGAAAIPANPAHISLKPRGVGGPFSVKVNANIGTSLACNDPEQELVKLQVAIEAGADAVMDLSTGGDMDDLRREIVRRSTVPVGTVPIYDAAVRAYEMRGDPSSITADEMIDAVIRHAEDGVDFVTLHCGVTRSAVKRVRESGRITRIVSRGGSLLAAWMERENEENPLYTRYDEVLEILRQHDVTISLGDGLRPGSLADATDPAQIEELVTLGELTKRAWEAGVQVMVEGPGHVPLHQVQANVVLQKRLCHGAPFYVLGPLVTDVGAGYDHITGAIGGALAGMSGADFLCYVTPAEHLALPDVDDVRRGVVATRIAAHAVDIARGRRSAIERDLQMSKCRAALDWQGQVNLALDPVEVRNRLKERRELDEECSMCGQLCAMKVFA
ncbi:MAG: phosphomethylpyrimidine synthase ThiC [bacterium]|nr:MAG: phosphomethylpyrimidine synthase ThiC [bacterium]